VAHFVISSITLQLQKTETKINAVSITINTCNSGCPGLGWEYGAGSLSWLLKS
jgi:hypothetical protein